MFNATTNHAHSVVSSLISPFNFFFIPHFYPSLPTTLKDLFPGRAQRSRSLDALHLGAQFRVRAPRDDPTPLAPPTGATVFPRAVDVHYVGAHVAPGAPCASSPTSVERRSPPSPVRRANNPHLSTSRRLGDSAGRNHCLRTPRRAWPPLRMRAPRRRSRVTT